MTTKEKILELLEASKETYLSGEEIAGELSVSRSAVWKAVKTLQNEGHAIDAVTNKGYRLAENADMVTARGIRKFLTCDKISWDISVLPSAASTNALVRDEANDGAAEGRFIVANEQTAGRGRVGRSFFSPRNTGIYMSLLLRPENYSAKQAARITTMAAVAICEAIEEVSGERAEIKWVNDIFVRGKKVCGILTEASFGMESGLLEYAVLGVGVNMYEPAGGFPEDVKHIAGAVFQGQQAGQSDAKNRLAAKFLDCFYGYYTAGDKGEYVKRYRERSFVIGKDITLMLREGEKSAFVTGIDDECRLLVKYPDGTQDCYSSGEISIRV